MRLRIMLFTAMIAIGAGLVQTQLHIGPEMRSVYVSDYKAVLPDLTMNASGKLSDRLSWRADAGWCIPRTARVHQEYGPRNLAVGDTTSRVTQGRSRSGLMGIAAGVQGDLRAGSGPRGPFWEVMAAFDDLTYWSETTTRYTHTGEVREGRGTSHRALLSLRVGVGYRMSIGPGQLRFSLMAAPLALEFHRFGGSTSTTFPIMGVGSAYLWRSGS